jgi:DMSO reductase family type II enzyme heme b subunit
MRVVNIAGPLTDPQAEAWRSVEAVPVALAPVALEAQPTAYIREAWKDRDYGQTSEARVQAASDGERLFLRVEWADDPVPNREFQDAVGAIFPTNGSGVLATMGTPEKPLAIWFWEDGRPGPLRLISSGPGIVAKEAADGLGANGALAGGNWSVVLSGPAVAAASHKVAFAVWNGSKQERAGLAAVSREWLPLEMEVGDARNH